MTKTTNDIERDFYVAVKDGMIGKSVRGGVYRRGMRPSDSLGEDAAVELIAGMYGYERSGIVVVRVYVPDIPCDDGRYAEDFRRVSFFESLIDGLVSSLCTGDYYVWMEEEPMSIKIEGINQHCVALRLNYKTLND